MHAKRATRRDFLIKGLKSLSLIPLVQIPTSLVRAQDNLVRIEESDPVAQALGYKHSAADVDASRFPAHATPEGQQQFCHNCMLYLAAADQEWGPCQIFPGKLVAGAGWCSAWVAAG